jgi:hypothetical protein
VLGVVLVVTGNPPNTAAAAVREAEVLGLAVRAEVRSMAVVVAAAAQVQPVAV